MNTKVCRRCGTEKPVGEFYKNKNLKDGLNSYCKKCSYEARRKSMEKNPDKYVNYSKNYYQKKKNIWNNYQTAKTPYVYRIKHKKTGEYYIGCTKQRFTNRIVKHFSNKCQTNSPFTGKNKNNYEFTILVFCSDRQQARKIEKDLLTTRVGSDPLCLNKVIGGK